MGDILADLGLPADAVTAAQSFVTVFLWVYTLLIFAYIIMSWIRVPYSLSPVQRFLHDVCEPYLRLFRRVLPTIGPLDLSPIVAVAVLYLIQRVVNDVILDRLH